MTMTTTPSLRMNILQMDDEGFSVQQICDTLAVPPAMVWEALAQEGIDQANTVNRITNEYMARLEAQLAADAAALDKF